MADPLSQTDAAGMPQQSNTGSNVLPTKSEDDDSSIAIKALQDLTVALNGLVQTVTQAT